jgi:hypothetical protein
MKLTLNDINNISGNPTSAEQLLNANFTAIEEAIENTLSRDGTTPNTLEAAMDANSHRILNLPYALTSTEPVTLAQVMALVTGEDWTGGVGIPAVVFYQEVEPTATAAGQVWVKLSDLSIWIWTGAVWLRQADPNLQVALDLANGNAASISDMQPRLIAVEDDVATVSTAIIDIETDVGNIAGEVTLITAGVDTNTAAIVSEQVARASADQALATAINTLQASNAQVWVQASAPVPGVSGIPNPIPSGSFWYDSDDYNKQYRYLNSAWVLVENTQYTTLAASITTEQSARIAADSALAVDVTNLWAQRNADYAVITTNNQARINGDTALALQYSALNTSVGTLSSTVTNNNQARIDGDATLASSVSAVNTSVGTLNTTVTQQATAINGIEGKYTVKIDANGYITGFGLVATSNTASPTSTFTVLADNFKIVTPGLAPVSPFYVSGGITYIRNVIIDEAAIGTATIGTIKVQNDAISNVSTNTLNFLGQSGPSLSSNVWGNLTTAYGTAQIVVTNIPTANGKVFIRTYLNAKRAGSSGENCLLRVRRDDGVVLPSNPEFRLTGDVLVYSWEFVDTAPVSTSHTYTLQVSRNGGGVIGDWYDIQLIATLLKR